jgi:hypothetical protein
LWSDGSDWAYEASPPSALASVATTDAFVTAAKLAGMTGAVVVHHNFPWTGTDRVVGYDHAYIEAALARHQHFLKAFAVADPTLEKPVASLLFSFYLAASACAGESVGSTL